MPRRIYIQTLITSFTETSVSKRCGVKYLKKRVFTEGICLRMVPHSESGAPTRAIVTRQQFCYLKAFERVVYYYEKFKNREDHSFIREIEHILILPANFTNVVRLFTVVAKHAMDDTEHAMDDLIVEEMRELKV